jgi:protein arginine kinase activator
MKCQVCRKNEATIHLTEIDEGQRSETHLCEECAAQEGIMVKSQISINELLSGLLGVQPAEYQPFDEKIKDMQCPHCGITLDQFRRDAVLGCPYDYQVFEKALLPLLEKVHDGNTAHCGKIPSKIPQDTKKNMELVTLQQQLDVAVQTEDYENAAKIRDKIKKMG